MKADLHIHTTQSDGSLTTQQVIKEAKIRGITHIGITNHDTTLGLREAITVGSNQGVTVIKGIEISAYNPKEKKKVHLLGYQFDLDAPHINRLCKPMLQARHKNALWQIKRLIEAGYKLSEEAIRESAKESEIIYKQHIMYELVQAGYAKDMKDPLHKKLFKGEGICSRDIEYVDVFEALEAIKKDKGLAILAHPGQLNSYDIIPQLIALGLDGIEINHKDHVTADQVKIRTYAKEKNLLLTGGSDFHGLYGDPVAIGEFLTPTKFISAFL